MLWYSPAARRLNIPCLFTVHNIHTEHFSLAQMEDRGIDVNPLFSTDPRFLWVDRCVSSQSATFPAGARTRAKGGWGELGAVIAPS